MDRCSFLQAAAAVKQQQAVIKHALGNTQQGSAIFPAGVPTLCPTSSARQDALSHASTATAAGSYHCQQAAPTSSMLHAPALPAAAHSPTSRGNGRIAQAHSPSNSSSRGGSRSSQKQPAADQKLAHRIVEACVDQVFAAKAQPNMAGGSFNFALSLQQAAQYEAAREAADLDRRLERGLVGAAAVLG